MPLKPTQSWNVAEPEVMHLSGRLDGDNASQIEEDALLCIKSGAREMVMDCSELTYVTGAGLRALLHIAHAMREARGRFAICDLQPQVRDMFTACGIENIISVYNNRTTAKLAVAA